MNSRFLMTDRTTGWSTWLVALIVVGLVTSAAWAADEKQTSETKSSTPTTISTGSGEKYKTTVDQKPGGELSPEDFRQVSLLSSRILLHLNEAVVSLDEDRTNDAGEEIEAGLTLIKVVREILPTTEITTVISDAKGSEVYRHVDQVQDDRIPIHEGLVAVKVVEAVTDAKREAADVTGVRLADADLLHTSVLLNLDYVEGRLNRAKAALPDKADDALQQLVLAQAHGISFSVNKQDSPLVAAQMALQLAEQMTEEDRVEAAKVNLQQAKNQLVLYRGLIGERDSDDVKKLEADISALQTNIDSAGAAEKIRSFWDQVANWFSRGHRETRTGAATGDSDSGS